jgi:hypothetical protein
MRWDDVRTAHPDRWLVVEALANGLLLVLDECPDGLVVMKRWRELRHVLPGRDLHFVHTQRHALPLAG